MNLAAFLTEHDIRFVMVNPMHVNRRRGFPSIWMKKPFIRSIVVFLFMWC
ncbi:IS110 family transposase [Gracilibacillus caseinilyticus]|uniref:IS110 family transposase n=1 Tax=Gracilibacillus caseinilyticus TaxID=2932256 RepID=A0ABY4EYN0_9BACI|nr:IS110 family transposase [Gracilibacillus caseinilyticus]UOQ49509.1 IS110 family transposase [Gracilibacillus caseinilyticus]